MRVLWISMYAPLSFSASAGSQTFHYYFKKFHNDKQFDIRLISCVRFCDKEKADKELFDVFHDFICWGDPSQGFLQKARNIESRYNPWNMNANLISNTDVGFIFKTLQEYKIDGYQPDIVILEWTPMVLLAGRIRQFFPDAVIIASEHDVTFVGYERKSVYYDGIKKHIWRQKSNWEKKKELEALSSCALILPHNPENIDLLVKEGIDKERLQWLCPYFHNLTFCQRNPNGRDVLFFGAMSRSENYLSAIWFIENVMPNISDIDVRFVVLGSNPPEELKKYQSERVIITGFVDSIVPYFESAICLVAPLVLGAGIKVKVLEGLSSGIPVITNDIGIEGIPAKDGINYIHAKDPSQYEKAIRDAKAGKLESIGGFGRRFIQSNYDIDMSVENYKERLVSLMDAKV